MVCLFVELEKFNMVDNSNSHFFRFTIPPTPLDSPFLWLVLKPELWSWINPHSLALIPVMALNVVSLLELTELKDFVASSSFVRT